MARKKTGQQMLNAISEDVKERVELTAPTNMYGTYQRGRTTPDVAETLPARARAAIAQGGHGAQGQDAYAVIQSSRLAWSPPSHRWPPPNPHPTQGQMYPKEQGQRAPLPQAASGSKGTGAPSKSMSSGIAKKPAPKKPTGPAPNQRRV